jgi:hypothetical protein
MPKRTDLLDRINIASPCSADWDEMLGNEQVRFCRHCSLHVHDLSKITRKDAVKLVAASKGKLCVRYSRRHDNTIHTATQAEPLARIKRRLSRIAAGAFTATLSLASNAAAQSSISLERSPSVVIEPRESGKVSALPDDPSKQTALPALLSRPSVDEPIEIVNVVQGGAMVIIPDTPLINAIWNGEMADVRILLAEGVDVNVVDGSTNSTALGEAVAAGNLELVQTLLDAGADANLRNSAGQTALMRLDDDGTVEIVLALIDAGAKVNLKDEDGDSALTVAAAEEKPDVLQALLDAGAKVNAKNKEGKTALMIAAENGNVENVKALLLAGADVRRKDKDGKTALNYARENDEKDVVEALIMYGAFE